MSTKSINDGFSGPLPAAPDKAMEFSQIPCDEYLSLLREGSPGIAFKIPESITREDHVPIACPDGSFILRADVYYQHKQPVKARPCIIFMHDWASGNNPGLCGDRQGSFFALNGFVFVALYYRPPKYSPCPAALEDLKTCARWIRSKAKEYSIDTDMVISFGSSAGSQWAFLAAASNGNKQWENQCGFNAFSSDINMVLLHAAICDIVRDFKDSDIMRTVLGCTYAGNPRRYEEFSPVCNINPAMPPVLIINGDLDQSCSIAAARELRDKLLAVKVKAELLEFPGRDHGSSGYPGDLFLKLNKYKEFILANWNQS